MLILLVNILASTNQNLDDEPQPSTANKVEAPEPQNSTLAEFEVENSSFLSKMCKLIPMGSMTSNLPMIPAL
ncbi:MAG: hypothetical protein AB4372_28900 [Xenococcus sp. (in: cyanobacteria)]